MIVFALTVISCKSETIETEKVDNTVKVQNSVSINDKEESTLDNKALKNQQASSFAKVKDGDCKGLHKVTSRDDLLQQMYATAFKSDCLYDMSNEELEKIWGIPVINDNKLNNKYTKEEFDKNPSVLFYDINSRLDFFVEEGNYMGSKYFVIHISRKAFKYGIQTLFPEGYFPKYFGTPVIKKLKHPRHPPPSIGFFSSEYGKPFKKRHSYIWENANQVMSTESSSWGAIHKFVIMQKVNEE